MRWVSGKRRFPDVSLFVRSDSSILSYLLCTLAVCIGVVYVASYSFHTIWEILSALKNHSFFVLVTSYPLSLNQFLRWYSAIFLSFKGYFLLLTWKLPNLWDTQGSQSVVFITIPHFSQCIVHILSISCMSPLFVWCQFIFWGSSPSLCIGSPLKDFHMTQPPQMPFSFSWINVVGWFVVMLLDW